MKNIKIKKKIPKPTFLQKLKFWKIYQTFEVPIPESWDEVNENDFLNLFAASLQKDDGLRMMNCIRSVLPTSIRDEVHQMQTTSLIRVFSFMSFCEPRKVGEDGGWLRDDKKLMNDPVLTDFVIKRGNALIEKLESFSLPGKDLENITCERFRDAVNAYSKIQGGYKEHAWEVIQAVFDTKVEAKVLAKHLSYPIPTFVIRYFMDCLEKIYQDISDISPTFFNTNGEGEGDGQGVNFGWDGVFLEIAKDGVFGTYQQVLKSRFHDVLVYSIKKYEDALEQKKALEKNAENV